MRRYKHDLLVVAYAVECYERRLIGVLVSIRFFL